jgi:hypothetical protein
MARISSTVKLTILAVDGVERCICRVYLRPPHPRTRGPRAEPPMRDHFRRKVSRASASVRRELRQTTVDMSIENGFDAGKHPNNLKTAWKCRASGRKTRFSRRNRIWHRETDFCSAFTTWRAHSLGFPLWLRPFPQIGGRIGRPPAKKPPLSIDEHSGKML